MKKERAARHRDHHSSRRDKYRRSRSRSRSSRSRSRSREKRREERRRRRHERRSHSRSRRERERKRSEKKRKSSTKERERDKNLTPEEREQELDEYIKQNNARWEAKKNKEQKFRAQDSQNPFENYEHPNSLENSEATIIWIVVMIVGTIFKTILLINVKSKILTL